MHLVRVQADSPISTSSSVSSSEPCVTKSPFFKSPFLTHLSSSSPSSDPHSLSSSAIISHPIYGSSSSSYSPFNCLPSNNNNSNSNGVIGSSREHNNEQQHQNLIHDRLLLQMAANNRQQHLSFDGHPPPTNGLWRPPFRPFIGKLENFLLFYYL